MSEVEKDLKMDAYYYGFSRTGEILVDRILSAIAWAGKAYHSTSEWNEECSPYEDCRGERPTEWIQNSANDAAKEIVILRAELAEKEAELAELRNRLKPVEEYKKHEFCKDVKCTALEYNTCSPIICHKTAKHFHRWLEQNGYTISKTIKAACEKVKSESTIDLDKNK